MALPDALDALGSLGAMARYTDEVPTAAIVGSEARAQDFDADFALVNRSLRPRHRTVLDGVRAGPLTTPVELVRLGDLYFVRDGHHRVSAARSLGIDRLPANVVRYCTVAYALCCLRAEHLHSKAAERRFLERLPVPSEFARDFWLDKPADWARLADAAQAWGYRSGLDGSCTAHDLAAAWWLAEVRPVVQKLRERGYGQDLRDVQVFVAALGARDRLGALDWPDGLDLSLPCCRRDG